MERAIFAKILVHCFLLRFQLFESLRLLRQTDQIVVCRSIDADSVRVERLLAIVLVLCFLQVFLRVEDLLLRLYSSVDEVLLLLLQRLDL